MIFLDEIIRSHRAVLRGMLALAVLAGFGMAQAAEVVRIVGASTILPVMRDVASALAKSDKMPIRVSGGGSDQGFIATATGTAEIGMVSRALHPNEKARVSAHLIGRDVVVPIVHESNPIQDLSETQLRDIYRGRLKHWSDLGGSDREIVVVAKNKGRSTREIWDDYLGLSGSITSSAHLNGANLATLLFVAADPGTIGYVSEGTLSDARKRGIRVRALTIGGRAPHDLKSENGKMLARELNLVTRGPMNEQARRILDFVRSAEGQRILLRHGFLPAVPSP